MDEESLKYELLKHKEQQEKRRALYSSEEFKAKRKAYFETHKDKLKAYRLRSNAKKKAILAKAKEMGLDKELEIEL
jgi:hypothetical protein